MAKKRTLLIGTKLKPCVDFNSDKELKLYWNFQFCQN